MDRLLDVKKSAHSLHDHIIDRTCRISDAMIGVSSRHLREQWNLRHTDLRLLNVLDGALPLSVNEISRRALVDQAWVSRSLRTLEVRKLVERSGDPADSRLILISLTKRGRAMLDELRPWAAWSEKALLEGIDAKKLKKLLDQLEANTDNLIHSLDAVPPELRPKRTAIRK